MNLGLLMVLALLMFGEYFGFHATLDEVSMDALLNYQEFILLGIVSRYIVSYLTSIRVGAQSRRTVHLLVFLCSSTSYCIKLGTAVIPSNV